MGGFEIHTHGKHAPASLAREKQSVGMLFSHVRHKEGYFIAEKENANLFSGGGGCGWVAPKSTPMANTPLQAWLEKKTPGGMALSHVQPVGLRSLSVCCVLQVFRLS